MKGAILLVEDERFKAEDIMLTAKEAGVQFVVRASTVEDGLRLIADESDKYEAVISDWSLFGRTGDEIVEAAQARGLPVVVVSGHSRMMPDVEWIEYGRHSRSLTEWLTKNVTCLVTIDRARAVKEQLKKTLTGLAVGLTEYGGSYGVKVSTPAPLTVMLPGHIDGVPVRVEVVGTDRPQEG